MTRASLAALAAMSACACGSTDSGPQLFRLEPNAVGNNGPTKAAAHGARLHAAVSIDLDERDAHAMRSGWQATLDEVALDPATVLHIDTETLGLIVPAGLPPGVHDFRVTAPDGAHASLRDALTVIDGDGPPGAGGSGAGGGVVGDTTIYRREVTVDNTANPTTLVDYQVSLLLDTRSLIAAGKMQPSCADLRFRDVSDTTPLGFWVEAGCNSPATRIWVRVPNAPGNAITTVYVRYGGSGATRSRVANTFIAGSAWETDDGLTMVEGSANESFGDTNGTMQSGGGMLTFTSMDRLADNYVYQSLAGPMTDGYAIRAFERVTQNAGSGDYIQPIAISEAATEPLTTDQQNALEIV